MKSLGWSSVLFATILRGNLLFGASTTVDLPTVLKLAGASSLDVQIARTRVSEAEAQHEAVRQKFYPWASVGASFRRHQRNTQAVDGTVLDIEKQSLSAGIVANAEWNIGETVFQELAAKQRTRAEGSAASALRQRVIASAAVAYYELLLDRIQERIAEDSVTVASGYAEQARAAQGAGLVSSGDVERVETQKNHQQLALAQAALTRREAAANLATALHLDPTVDLLPSESELAPIAVVTSTTDLSALVARAVANRAETEVAEARLAASREEQRAARYGPLVPTLSAQFGYGGLGGGPGDASPFRRFDVSEDYLLALSWRVGPGGVFDRSRIHEQDAKRKGYELNAEKIRDQIRLEVVTTHARVASLAKQIDLGRAALDSAEKTAAFSRDRTKLQVSTVLEEILAENDLIRARQEYALVVARYNQAQYALKAAVGDLTVSSDSKPGPATP